MSDDGDQRLIDALSLAEVLRTMASPSETGLDAYALRERLDEIGPSTP